MSTRSSQPTPGSMRRASRSEPGGVLAPGPAPQLVDGVRAAARVAPTGRRGRSARAESTQVPGARRLPAVTPRPAARWVPARCAVRRGRAAARRPAAGRRGQPGPRCVADQQHRTRASTAGAAPGVAVQRLDRAGDEPGARSSASRPRRRGLGAGRAARAGSGRRARQAGRRPGGGGGRRRRRPWARAGRPRALARRVRGGASRRRPGPRAGRGREDVGHRGVGVVVAQQVRGDPVGDAQRAGQERAARRPRRSPAAGRRAARRGQPARVGAEPGATPPAPGPARRWPGAG